MAEGGGRGHICRARSGTDGHRNLAGPWVRHRASGSRRRDRRTVSAVRRFPFVVAGAVLAGLLAMPVAEPVGAATPLPGAPSCPIFPADNVWNTDISTLPVDVHSPQ